MKLITFQPIKAFKEFQKTGILRSNPTPFIDMEKYQIPYDFVIQKMLKNKIAGHSGENYPIWAWAKCGASIAPKRRKNTNHKEQNLVKITCIKPDNEVLLSDYMAYSCILSGHIVPNTKQEYESFLKDLEQQGIALEDLKALVRSKEAPTKAKKKFKDNQKTRDRIFDLKSNVHQACVWHITFGEVQKIEKCDSNYLYNSMNPLRADGTRPNWKVRYLKFLP